MASLAKRLSTNVEGDLYVDSTCIDCDTCRWMAPGTFDRAAEQSRVHSQPATDEERTRALMALLSCPTASIGTSERSDLKPALARLPDPVDEGVYHCGFHPEASFGAASYLIRRETGNVLVDSPRFAGPLVKRLEELGGVDWLLLSHKDDVADHAKFASHFGARRVLHRDDVDAGTAEVEQQLEGTEPIRLDDELLAIPVPGHTRGSVCFLYRERFLFTGDHLAWSERLGHLYAFRRACWYDWDVQRASMERLVEHAFEWVLPGHGRRTRLTPGSSADAVRRCVAWMA